MYRAGSFGACFSSAGFEFSECPRCFGNGGEQLGNPWVLIEHQRSYRRMMFVNYGKRENLDYQNWFFLSNVNI